MRKAKELFDFFQSGYASENGHEGTYEDVLIDGCYDLEKLAYMVEEWIAADVNKIVEAINRSSISADQKKEIADYLRRFKDSAVKGQGE